MAATHEDISSPTSRQEIAPWTLPVESVADLFGANVENGLPEAEAKRRLQQHGPNRLREYKPRSVWTILAGQFKSLIVGLLVVAAAVAFAFGDVIEGWAIVAVIILNAAIGFFVELRAIRSMEALYAMSRVTANVRRDGALKRVPAESLVPGDIIHVEGGDVIAADARIFRSSKLQSDESALTGESMPVGKTIEKTNEAAPLAERAGMLYKGTFVSRGIGEGIVVSTGMDTELGAITSLVYEAQEEETPLEKRLDQLGHKLIAATLAIVVLVTLSGILSGKEIILMIQTGISLAVAAIPEGLPIVATLAMARGVQLMARRHALINRMASVETLGATSVIFTDKTGTLTENKMKVTHLVVLDGVIDSSADDSEQWRLRDIDSKLTPEQHKAVTRILEIGVLCNTAQFDEVDSSQGIGDPLEVALLDAGFRAGLDRSALIAAYPEVREEAFDPEIKLMATFHEDGDAFLVAVKGAPEIVLQASDREMTASGAAPLSAEDRQRWTNHNEELAKQGLRVVALATRTVAKPDTDPYEKLVFLGLAGLSDPPRPEVHGAIDQCKRAGIQVVMLTGDQPATALRIARLTGIVEEKAGRVIEGSALTIPDSNDEKGAKELLAAPIFARVSPKQKLDLIEIHQRNGRIVAMTGDGVNDAPGLKKADIGIAMGRRGTEVAREAADMVLQDDSFASIVEAVKQGRVIFANIRRFAFYLMSCNVSEVMIVGFAAVAGATLPILPLQILFLNLVTDVFPALALGVGKGDSSVLGRPPRDPGEPFLGRWHWAGITAYGLVFTGAVLGALWLSLTRPDSTPDEAVSISFLTLAFAQLWHVFNMRPANSRLFSNEITRNPYVWAALALCTSLILLAVFVPALATVLDIHPPDAAGWRVIIGMSLIPLLAGQILKMVRRLKHA